MVRHHHFWFTKIFHGFCFMCMKLLRNELSNLRTEFSLTCSRHPMHHHTTPLDVLFVRLSLDQDRTAVSHSQRKNIINERLSPAPSCLGRSGRPFTKSCCLITPETSPLNSSNVQQWRGFNPAMCMYVGLILVYVNPFLCNARQKIPWERWSVSCASTNIYIKQRSVLWSVKGSSPGVVCKALW